MSRRYYVLDSDPNDLSFLDTMQDALDLLWEQHGMRFNYAFYDQGSIGLGRHVYGETEKRAIISLVEDFAVPVCYLIVEAASQEEVDCVGGWLREYLPFISLQELQEKARQKMIEEPETLVRMALGTNELADPVSLEILRNGLRSDDELVRFRAATAASLTQWSDFLPDLKPMMQNDPSPELREMASRAVKACQQRVQAGDTSEKGGDTLSRD